MQLEFAEVSRPEAEAFLADLVARAPERAEALRAEVAATGGHELDYSPASLVPLWTWVLRRVRPPGRWRRRRADAAPIRTRLDAGDLELAERIAAYAGEVVRRAVPGAGWFLWDDGGLSNDHQAPVLGTREHDANIRTSVHNALVLRRDGSRPDDPAWLARLLRPVLEPRRPLQGAYELDVRRLEERTRAELDGAELVRELRTLPAIRGDDDELEWVTTTLYATFTVLPRGLLVDVRRRTKDGDADFRLLLETVARAAAAVGARVWDERLGRHLDEASPDEPVQAFLT